MSPNEPKPPLRAVAEAELSRAAKDASSAPPGSDLLHELQVHQLELEMQNEALRQSQGALETARDRYLDLYEFAPVGYLTLTPNGQIAEANLAAAALFGRDRKMLVGARFDLAVQPADRARWQRAFAAAKADAARVTCEVALEGQDPAPGIDVHVDMLRAAAEYGQTSLRVTLTDISERKRAEAALERYRLQLEAMVAERTVELIAARDAAEAANRAKSAFLANMSHEIRTPLNGLLGTAYLMQRAGVTPKQGQQLATISAAGHHLLAIINDVLELARIDAGRIALKERDFGLGELLHALTDLIGDAAGAKGLSLRVDMAGMPERLRGDATLLKQALHIYLGNAVKFTAQGGITLEGRLLEETPAGYLLRFVVTDTGVGVAADVIGRLFNPFQQADDSMTRTFGGTGLGLVIVKRIAALMGGNAGVDSAVGKGSRFWLDVRLGRARAPDGRAEEAREAAEVRLRRDHSGTRVLLAEDERLNREMTLELLQVAGLSPESATGGQEAVRMVEQRDYALVLMDVQMPGMTGLEAARAIRALPGKGDTPIVALTASCFGDDRRACEAAGMNDFIAKPLEPEQLYATVLKWLERD